MKIKFPLYVEILFWFFLNVVFLCAVFAMVAHFQFRFGLDLLISGPAGNRLQTVSQLIASELRDRPRADWDDVLERFNDAYHVQFVLFRDRKQIAGTNVDLPQEVIDRLASIPGRNPPPPPSRDESAPPGQPSPEEMMPPPAGNRLPPMPEGRRFLVHTSSPSRYWVVMRIPMPPAPDTPPRPGLLLIAISDNLSGGGLFFDMTSWLIAASVAIVISVLFWFPLVRGITRSISQMTNATEQIAEGRFDVRTNIRRQDELGSLGEAINRMAHRLSGYVAGQKRFLGDIAHELCSPIARIQVALGILEQRANPTQKEYLDDLREEVSQMSVLVNELLSFSKASLGGAAVKLQSVTLNACVEKAIARETASGISGEITNQVPEDMLVQADPELLLRAVGNVLRNAIRYAGNAGPITISAVRAGSRIELFIDDSGLGIPPDAIAQVFEPFYRVDPSRDRETGGVGLGLCIVKTCVESCGGTVRCENRQPKGLRVTITLKSVE